MTKTSARNKHCVRFVMQDVSRKVRKTRALVAIRALQAALKSTWQDSGQFAANWTITVGHGSRRSVSPDFSRGTHPIGRRGEKRSDLGREKTVYSFKLREHGINGNNPEITALFSQLSRAKGRMPEITIFNPLFDKGVSSGHNTPKPYWYYATAAHPGHYAEEAIRLAVDKAVATALQKSKDKSW